MEGDLTAFLGPGCGEGTFSMPLPELSTPETSKCPNQAAPEILQTLDLRKQALHHQGAKIASFPATTPTPPPYLPTPHPISLSVVVTLVLESCLRLSSLIPEDGGTQCVVEPRVGQALAPDTFPSLDAPPFLLMAWTQGLMKYKQGLVDGASLGALI